MSNLRSATDLSFCNAADSICICADVATLRFPAHRDRKVALQALSTIVGYRDDAVRATPLRLQLCAADLASASPNLA